MALGRLKSSTEPPRSCLRKKVAFLTPPSSPLPHALASAATPRRSGSKRSAETLLRFSDGSAETPLRFSSSESDLGICFAASHLARSSTSAASCARFSSAKTSAAFRARIISTQAVKFRRYPKERCFVFILRPGGLTNDIASDFLHLVLACP